MPPCEQTYIDNLSIASLLINMAEEKGEFVPTQKFIGMQVIDSRGFAVGTVKDLGVNIVEKKFNLIVTTRARSDIQISWEDIQSVLDVVLLRKEIEMPKSVEPVSIPPPPPPMNICPNCGTSVVPAAKFCPKCGSKLK
jgi:sporulation protein YlmC with PRC-barrel domain